MHELKIKRVYEEKSDDDGQRILIDRLWPRGVKKEDAEIDKWMKDIAPTSELRKWFHQDLERFLEFKTRYKKELAEHEPAIAAVKEVISDLETDDVTLIYAAKNEQRNHAIVLKAFIDKKMK